MLFQLSAESDVVLRDSYVESFAVGGVVDLGELRSEADLHSGGVCTLNENLVCHLAGSVAKVEVGDAQAGDTAAAADAFLTGNDGDTGGQRYVVDGLGAGGGGVIGREVEHIALGAGGSGDVCNIVGVCEGEFLDLKAELLEHRGDGVGLELGVRLAGAV